MEAPTVSPENSTVWVGLLDLVINFISCCKAEVFFESEKLSFKYTVQRGCITAENLFHIYIVTECIIDIKILISVASKSLDSQLFSSFVGMCAEQRFMLLVWVSVV